MKRRVEAVTPPEVIERLLAIAGEELVLVGGQALAFWVQRYGVPTAPQLASISADMDFLTDPADRNAVKRLAEGLHGSPIFPPERALTALVGQAIRPVSDEEYLNVDVIFKVIGLTKREVESRAIRIERTGAAPFRVMHPLDVLRSRTANLHKLREKQNEKGAMQLVLAVSAVREFLREQAKTSSTEALARGRSPVQDYVSAIEQLACEDAARKIASRWGIFVADAIDPLLIPAGPFWSRRWPGLRELMSADYRSRIEASAKARKLLDPGAERGARTEDDGGSPPVPRAR